LQLSSPLFFISQAAPSGQTIISETFDTPTLFYRSGRFERPDRKFN
jgi:hypothetical protein